MTVDSIRPLESVETPAGIVDLSRARANAERVAAYCRDHGLSWRPHVKTHKCTSVARIQLEAGVGGPNGGDTERGGGHGHRL